MEEIEKKPIDFASIVKKLWPHRKQYAIVMASVLIVTYLFTLCLPRYYKCSVSLAPETGGVSVSGSLSSLASSFGLGSSLAKMNSQDAIYSEIYPDVLESKNFIAELMPVQVKTKDGDIQCNYYTYMRDKQKAPWWDDLKMVIANLFKKAEKDTYDGKQKLSVFGLSKEQSEIFGAVKGKIKCIVDKKTDVISITVEDQDPMVCAIMADSTCKKLQEFIVEYRTNKARVDYDYYRRLCDDSKAKYEEALRKYASYSDTHTSTILTTYQAKQESLENEMQAMFNIYTAMNSQMQAAAAKLQEGTPAFTVIESASIPVKPTGPKRMIISIVMMILSFFVLSGWYLIKAK